MPRLLCRLAMTEIYETFRNSSNFHCHCEEGVARRGNPSSPTVLSYRIPYPSSPITQKTGPTFVAPVYPFIFRCGTPR